MFPNRQSCFPGFLFDSLDKRSSSVSRSTWAAQVQVNLVETDVKNAPITSHSLISSEVSIALACRASNWPGSTEQAPPKTYRVQMHFRNGRTAA